MKRQSKLEAKLELILRGLKLNYVKEYRFHPTRRWRVDFYLPKYHIAIECEGGVYMPKSGHTSLKGFTDNARKYNELTLLNIKLLRFTTKDFEIPLSIYRIIKRAVNE